MFHFSDSTNRDCCENEMSIQLALSFAQESRDEFQVDPTTIWLVRCLRAKMFALIPFGSLWSPWTLPSDNSNISSLTYAILWLMRPNFEQKFGGIRSEDRHLKILPVLHTYCTMFPSIEIDSYDFAQHIASIFHIV
ncbi:hypothetical protein BLOT_014985 [Blomia tropicalis]|nr:hypothetical protein BLOT_014985 [Blomia tropicalis]